MKKERNLELNYKDAKKLCKRWPWAADSIDDVKIVNVLQFLTPAQRIHFVNELHRVLKKGSKAQIIAPHWCASRAHGDLAFVYPPIAEAWFPHLNAEWRKAQAPWGKHYKCDFDHTLGYGLHPSITSRNPDYQNNAVTFWKEAAQDVICTLIKR